MLKWLVVAVFLSSLVGATAFASEEPAIRLDSPLQGVQPPPEARPPFRYDPLHEEPAEDGPKLDSPYYTQDAVRAMLGYLPADTPLGPPDIADDAWNLRMERLGELSRKIGSRPRHSATILGMECDLTSPLGYMCHIPHTDCVIGVGMPFFGCPF